MANNLSANDFQLGVQVVPKTDQLNNEFKKISQTATLNVNVKINDQSFKKVNKVVETYSNNLGKTYQQTTILNQANEVLYSSTTKLNEKFKPFNKEVKQSSQNLSETAKTAKQASGSITNLGEATSKAETQAKSLGQSFGDIVTKVGKFYLATKPIQMMQQAFDDAIETVKEFDDAMTDLRKVSDLEGQALDDYTKKLGELGETVARTRVEMVQNATIFKQAGYSDDDAATLARVASLYQNVADSEVSAQEAGQFVVSQLKAYGLAASDAASIVDKLNAVSNNYSVSNSDLAIGLTKSAAALQTLGNTQDEVMGLLTAGTEQLTGQASKVGKGLQTIGINIAQVATEAGELSYEVGNTTKTISLLDEATGDMRSTFDVLSDIAKDWNNMTDAQQTAISNALAGKTRFDVFAAVMTRFDDAISATTTSMNSFGSAEAENAKYMESLSAKTALLKQQFQELVLGDGGLEKVGKIFLDLSINTLKLVNDLGGLKTIAIALIGLAVVNKADTIVSLFKNLPLLITSTTTSMKGYLTAVYATITGNKELTAALELEGIAVNSAKLAFGSFFAVLTLGIAIYSHLKQAEEEALAQRQETIKTAKDEIASLEQLKSKLDDESLTREDLSNIVSNSTISAYKDEMDAISDLNEARQGAIDKIDEEIQKNAELIKSTGFTDYVDAIEELGDQTSRFGKDFTSILNPTLGANIVGFAKKEGLEFDTSSLQGYYDSLMKIQEAMLSDSPTKYKTEIDALSTAISNANKDLQSNNQIIQKYNEALGALGEVYDATLGKIVPMTEEQKEVYKTQQESTEALNKQGQAYELTDEEIQQYAEDMGISIDEAKEQLGIITEQAKSYEDLAKSIGVSTEELQSYAEMLGLTAEQAALLLSEQNSLNSEIDGIQSAYSTLSSAVKEYNEQGGYSIDTLQSLLELDPEYLSMLQFEGEQLTINEEAIRNRVIAWAEEAKQGAYNIAIERMKALAAGQSGEATEDSAQKSVGAIEKHKKNTEAILNEANAELYLATVEARRSKLGTADDEIKQIYTDLENQLNAIDKLVDNVGKNFEGTMGSASKSTKSSVKEQKSALDQLKDKYKDVINFILDGYDKQIDKLEDTRDAEIDRIEDQIDAIEKEKDAQLDAIDAEIDALEKERDARKEYWDAQLDALEKNNDAVNDAITLQEKLNALATAQQTKKMVFKNGRFRYSSDEEADSSAQSDIDEFNREQEYKKQKELLEKLRDDELNNYDERLEALQDFRTEREKYYEDLKEQLEEQKDYLKDYYENRINDLKAQKEATKELLENGVKDQKEYEDKMLAQLGNFVADWNATVGAMSFPDISGSGIDVGSISVSKTSSGGSSTKTTKTTTVTKPKTTTRPKSTKSKDKNIHVKGGRIMAYASGTNSIKDNEIALVGDNPKYRELVIGSKLNNDQGTLMRLSSGSGVVNADSTKTLASIFNSLSGQINSAPFANNGVNNGTKISIGSISLPEVKDGQGFVDYMQHFSTDITQQSFNRV